MDSPTEAGDQVTTMVVLKDLVDRAQQCDRSVLPQLRENLDNKPRLWQEYGDLAHQAQLLWLSQLAGKDVFLEESVRRKLDELRAQLAGTEPSPLEKLLVERILACWLQVHYADCLYVQARGPESTPAVRQELMKRQDSSQKRYLASIKQLALLRKLVRPALSPYELATRAVQEGAPTRAPRTSRIPGPDLAIVN